ncbi:alkaline phosphatase family protein [Granulicella sp. dw_53]|uniref:phospholipase C n=1 Tax=Granulicella sp. dw_53 TaxID=2719792 RepID=UPI001BD45845|nr:alkaline phosphatase family protein [Granulicella sp. dw_53]
MFRKLLALSLTSSLVLSGCSSGVSSNPPGNGNGNSTPTATPTTASAAIKHVVVIFGENVSFDHYFGSYPNALNLPGETKFTAATGTPVPNNYVSNPGLLTNNPNMNGQNAAGAANPYRLSPAQALTADQDHGYTDEQGAFNNGKMDLFPLSVGSADTAALAVSSGASAVSSTKGLTMGYYDGNTVTAYWNYAQRYAMSDHSFNTTFGPSTPGAINLISGQTNGIVAANTIGLGSSAVADGNGGMTLISDGDPYGDVCSSTSKYLQMAGKNVGDLLNDAKVSWGWFEGGFDLSITNPNGTTNCKRSTVLSVSGQTGAVPDYVPHHQPFQYYASTANPTHARPSSVAAIGTTDAANHQYDMHDFTDALAAGNLPAVSFLKAPAFQDGHAANSDPIDEGTFVATTINALQKSSFWSSTAVIIAYDDSDGWYDHVINLVNGSATTSDKLNGAGICLSATAASSALPGVDGKPHAQGRCGYGPRLPLLVVSSWAKKNYIDSTVTDQSSVLKFIEDTFLSGQRIGQGSFDSSAGSLNNMFDFSNGAAAPNATPLILNTATGAVTSGN